MSSNVSGEVPLITCASFHPRFTASWTPVFLETKICTVESVQRSSQLALGRLAVIHLLFSQHDAHEISILDLAQGISPLRIATEAPRRLFGHLDLGDQVADRGIPPREFDPCRLANEAAPAIASDKVRSPQRGTIRQLNIDAILLLSEPDHLATPVNRHRQLSDPLRQDALDVLLAQHKPVAMTTRKVADIDRYRRKRAELSGASLREKAIRDAALLKQLDGASMQPSRTSPLDILGFASLDDRHVDPRQRQLSRQHQARRPPTDNHHRMLRRNRTAHGFVVHVSPFQRPLPLA